MKDKPKRETVEMLDRRIYFSDDGWQTVYMRAVWGRVRLVTDKKEADLVRFLAASQASAAA